MGKLEELIKNKRSELLAIVSSTRTYPPKQRFLTKKGFQKDATNKTDYIELENWSDWDKWGDWDKWDG